MFSEKTQLMLYKEALQTEKKKDNGEKLRGT
jgi:hypothetical protein